MSDSYKRRVYKSSNPCSKRYHKRQASKAVRRGLNVPNGSGYKKLYSRYDIDSYHSDGRFARLHESRWWRLGYWSLKRNKLSRQDVIYNVNGCWYIPK